MAAAEYEDFLTNDLRVILMYNKFRLNCRLQRGGDVSNKKGEFY
jgi:hypothetical protein